MNMNNKLKSLCGLLLAAIAVGAPLSVNAAEVRVGLSARETYVGLPVTLRIQVSDSAKADAPVVPSIDGVDIKTLGTPAQSTQITTINGRTTTSTTKTFAYELTPQHAGTFRIPSIPVDVDGATQHTRPIEFVASKSETGDLMFVEIAGKEKQIYVGQALDLTLKIWLRPFSDRRLKITLSEGDMWRLISDRSEWGPFAERIQQLGQKDQRPQGKEVLRKDANGVEHSYYLYQLDATIYPKRPGTIDGNNVKIIMNYPTALGRSRGPFADFFQDMPGGPSGILGDDDDFSPFGAQLTIQTVRPLSAQAAVEPINVLPIPTAGRPADYRGAVGQYQIAVDATPTHVKSGDPINLLIGISGTGPMELVQAPPLAELPKLAADFKVPSEPLAGFVKGERKIFQTTIRPRKPGVTQIPAIPFSYFDPAKGKFVTVHSDPVSIDVEPAEMLALDSVVNGRQTTSANPNVLGPATATAESVSLANFTGENMLAPQAPWTLNFATLIPLLILPPLVVLAIAVVRARPVFGKITSRFGSTAGRFEKAVTQSKDSAEIAALLKQFLVKQCKLNGTDVGTETVVGAMRVSGRRNLAIRCERLLNMCANEGGALPIGEEYSLARLKGEAKQWLQDWQTENLRPRPKPNARKFKRSKSSRPSSLQSSTVKIVAAVAIAGSLLYSRQNASAQAVATFDDKPTKEVARVELSTMQQNTLLAEANKCYNTALEKVQTDSADAKQGFADAADKYQLLVSSGVTNSRLYFNLANAYLESGQTSRAIANYLRCLRIEPTMREALLNLAYAKKMLHAPAGSTDAKVRQSSFGAYASIANEWLNSRVSPRAVFVTMIAAWISVWTIIGMRLLGFYFPWKSATSAAILMFILAAASSCLSWQTAETPLAVVVQMPVGAGANVDVATSKVSQGQIVEPIQKRAGSVRVRAANGETIWLPDDSLEVI